MTHTAFPSRLLLAAALLLGCAAAQAADARIASWSAAPQAVPHAADAPGYLRTPVIEHRTVRQIVYSSLAGTHTRIRLSNRYGEQPLEIDAIHLAASPSGAAIRPESDRVLSFRGARRVVVPPGAEIESDPADLSVAAGERLAVSLYIGGRAQPDTWHKLASQTAYLSTPGDQGAAAASAFKGAATSWFWLTGLSVVPQSSASHALVAIGDSITDGMRSTLNQNRRWPDDYARRLADAGVHDVAVLNQGISGNRLLSDSPCYGERLAARFERDALMQPGVRAIVLLIGINDINFAAMPRRAGLDCDAPHTQVQAADLINGYRKLIDAAHRKGLAIYGATLTPASLPPERETLRQQVNQALRAGIGFDDVVDFDQALRDPQHPTRLLPRYDSGDHIHPSDAGYAAMAAALPIEWARRKANRTAH